MVTYLLIFCSYCYTTVSSIVINFPLLSPSSFLIFSVCSHIATNMGWYLLNYFSHFHVILSKLCRTFLSCHTYPLSNNKFRYFVTVYMKKIWQITSIFDIKKKIEKGKREWSKKKSLVPFRKEFECMPGKAKIVRYHLTFWHRSFTFNSNKSPTWCNNFSVYYPDVCLQLNMFRAGIRPKHVEL